MQRILLADDDRALTDLLAEYLRREGFAVDVAHDGAAALEQTEGRAGELDQIVETFVLAGEEDTVDSEDQQAA